MHNPVKTAVLFFKKKYFFIALLIAGALLTGVFAYRQAGLWLFVSDTLPGTIDGVCTFAGEKSRVEYTRTLMNRYSTTHWFLSDYKNGYRRILQNQQFDMARLTSVDTCKSTISEVNVFSGWIRELRAAHDRSGDTATLSIGLISSPYHMRRIKIMAGRRIRTERVRLYCLPVPFNYYKWNHETMRHWWRSNALTQATTSELFKLGYFMLTGYF